MAREKLNFDRLMDELNQQQSAGILLDNCMSLDPAVIRQIPLRYRIIALGFVRGMKLDELQQKLLDNGCPKLYARSLLEATLIFAFSHGISYPAWKELCTECADLLEAPIESPYFHDARITYAELERYVTENSETAGTEMDTRMVTESISSELTGSSPDAQALRTILWENSRAFSPVREKTRYYFCKYLYYYLRAKQQRYFKLLQDGADADDALLELLPFKVVTKLRRNKTMPEAEKRQLLHDSPISCGELFSGFNLFYFGYVSLDWISILLETYSDIRSIPAEPRHKLAEAARRSFNTLKNEPDDINAIKAYIRLTEAAEDADDGNGYGKNRSGEHAVFGYLKGTTDISRTALLCFLLFFASERDGHSAEQLTEDRLQEILSGCGYSPLRPDESDFDWFVSEFLLSDDPESLLQDLMTESAVRFQQNSFLYRVYCGSGSLSAELRELTE